MPQREYLAGEQCHYAYAAPIVLGAGCDVPVFVAPFACTIVSATLISDIAVTANDTNYRSINLVNKAATGGGTVAVTTIKSTLATGALGMTANKEWALGAVVTAADAHKLAAGDVLNMVQTIAAAGVAIGNQLLKIVYKHQ